MIYPSGRRKSGRLEVITLVTFTGLLLYFGILLPPAVHSEGYYYITPSTEIPIRSGKTQKNRIVAIVPDGARVELLEEDGPWACVRTGSGKEGWMLRRYLSKSPPLRDIVDGLKRKNRDLIKETDTLHSKLAAISSESDECKRQLETCIAQADSTRKSYEILKRDSENVVQIKKMLTDTVRELETARQELATSKQKIHGLENSNNIKWFVAGAGVLLIGWIIGLITGRKKRRRTSLL